MFKKKGFELYGLVGILLVILTEINFFLQIEPLATWYFPIIWTGYILIIDGLVYKIKGKSLIKNRFKTFLGMVFISALLWYIFEFFNVVSQNWSYIGTIPGGIVSSRLATLRRTLSFATVLPALFETTELIRSIKLFKNKKLKRKHKITKRFLYIIFTLGVLSFFLPIFLPKYAYPLIWISFFLILDPINYINKQPSIIQHLKDRKLNMPLSLLLAGIIIGFFWEFWNYWAISKWTYKIPFLGFFKIFEMPILGYLGYFPFAFELYAMYWFIRSLFLRKEKFLV